MNANLETDLPPALRVALAYAPAVVRPATLSLLALDTRIAGFVRRGREPLPTQMRLAWWRDTLRAPQAEWPRGDPLLDLLRGWRAPGRLVALVDGWEQLLADRLDRAAISEFAEGRVRAWAALAEEIGAHGDPRPAARTWALADLAANLSDRGERAAVAEVAGEEPYVPPVGRVLRPLAILGGLGRRSLARGGGPLLEGRAAALAALRLGLFGR